MRVLLLIALLLNMTATFGQAFDTLAVSKPPISNSPGYEFPRIDNDNRAIFRVRAPNAKKVQVDLGGLQDMTMGTDSVWTVITKPLVPGFHYYWLVIDGVRVADPASESYFGTGKMTSGNHPRAGTNPSSAATFSE